LITDIARLSPALPELVEGLRDIVPCGWRPQRVVDTTVDRHMGAVDRERAEATTGRSADRGP
jgi:hypothetical protein